jgi:hypothetical protein
MRRLTLLLTAFPLAPFNLVACGASNTQEVAEINNDGTGNEIKIDRVPLYGDNVTWMKERP